MNRIKRRVNALEHRQGHGLTDKMDGPIWMREPTRSYLPGRFPPWLRAVEAEDKQERETCIVELMEAYEALRAEIELGIQQFAIVLEEVRLKDV